MSGDRRPRDQRGSAAVELVLWVPSLMLLVALIVAGGRVWFARAAITDAAYAAARAASLSNDSAQAHQRAQSAFDRSLATAGLACRDRTLRLDTTGFTVPPGQPARIRASVRCVVRLDDLALPASTDLVIEAHGGSPLDTYRERE